MPRMRVQASFHFKYHRQFDAGILRKARAPMRCARAFRSGRRSVRRVHPHLQSPCRDRGSRALAATYPSTRTTRRMLFSVPPSAFLRDGEHEHSRDARGEFARSRASPRRLRDLETVSVPLQRGERLLRGAASLTALQRLRSRSGRRLRKID